MTDYGHNLLFGTFITLLLVVFIGESIRDAFDPKELSQLQ